MRWVSEGHDRMTEFSEFNANDTEMAQVHTKTAASPVPLLLTGAAARLPTRKPGGRL
jgi:hypothetical protein